MDPENAEFFAEFWAVTEKMEFVAQPVRVSGATNSI
jgi:hypothetical protein